MKLPLAHDSLALVAGSAKLDGRSIEVVWPAAQRALAVTVDQPGVYRLELGFEPVLRSEGGMTGFELAIPPLPEATLTVTTVGDPATVEVSGARGAVTLVKPEPPLGGSGEPELRANLGPSDRIGLRWPDEKNLPASLPNLDVEELIWVKLQPGSPVIDARFKFRVIDGKVRRVRVLVDPRLRLLPSWSTASAVTALHTLPGDPETIEMELSAAAGEQVVVDLTFLVAGTSGIGNFRLPRLEAAGARLIARLLAVTLDPALHFEEQLGDDVRQLTPADFMAAWGDAAGKPQLVYSIPRGEAAWSLATRPRESRSSVEQNVTLDVGPGTAAVQLAAAINTTAGHQFQLRLAGPPDLDIDHVSLLDEGVERVARWAKGDAGAITAFLTGPVSGRQQLSLVGRMPVPAAGEFEFVGFRWPAAEVKKNQLQIFRQPQVLLDVEPAADAANIDPLLIERGRPESGRLVGAYQLSGPQTALKLKVRPNSPQTAARETIVVERDQEVWMATVDYQLSVHGGLVDALRFEVPPSWSEPYQLDRAGAGWRSCPSPAKAGGSWLSCRPSPSATPIGCGFAGGWCRRPATGCACRTSSPAASRSWNVLSCCRSSRMRSTSIGKRPGWSRRRFRSTGGRAGRGQPLNSYQVLGERFGAQLKSIEHTSGRPRVRLADISAAWRADGGYVGAASFDLDPAGSSQVVLAVPPQVELLQVSVAGVPAVLAPSGPDGWRLQLQSAQLPQRVEAIFRGTLPVAGGPPRRVELPAPSIDGVDVERTLWTVYAPAAAGTAIPPEPTGALSPVRQELVRLEANEAILDLGSHVAGEQAPEEVRRWYSAWNARFVAARDRIQAWSRAAGRASAARDQELEAVSRREQSIAERLGMGPGPVEPPSRSFEAARLVDGLAPRVRSRFATSPRATCRRSRSGIRMRPPAISCRGCW